MYNILAIDTAGAEMHLALKTADGAIRETTCQVDTQGNRSGDEVLAAEVEQLLGEAKLKSTSLTQLVYGQGPGSFTGLRIGLGFLKGISFALKIPIVPVCSLTAYAFHALAAHNIKSNQILTLIQSGREELFSALFLSAPFTVLKEPGLTKEANLLSDIESSSGQIDSASLSIVGYTQSASFAGRSVLKPRSVGRALLAIASEAGQFSLDSLVKVEPSYLRGVSARTIAERSK